MAKKSSVRVIVPGPFLGTPGLSLGLGLGFCFRLGVGTRWTRWAFAPEPALNSLLERVVLLAPRVDPNSVHITFGLATQPLPCFDDPVLQNVGHGGCN